MRITKVYAMFTDGVNILAQNNALLHHPLIAWYLVKTKQLF